MTQLSLHGKLPEFDPKPGCFGRWLDGTTANWTVDSLSFPRLRDRDKAASKGRKTELAVTPSPKKFYGSR